MPPRSNIPFSRSSSLRSKPWFCSRSRKNLIPSSVSHQSSPAVSYPRSEAISLRTSPPLTYDMDISAARALASVVFPTAGGPDTTMDGLVSPAFVPLSVPVN